MINDTFDFVKIEKNHIFSKRTMKGKVQILEAVPNVWAMSLIHIMNGSVTLKTGLTEQTFQSGLYGSYLPPFSFVEYHGTFEKMEMTTISSSTSFASLPQCPVVFPIDTAQSFPSLSDAAAWLTESVERSRTEIRPIGRGTMPSGISIKIKRIIDGCYADPLTLSEIAKKLRLSQALMTMHFKKSFFLPPTQYRTCLRLIDAAMQLSRSRSTGARVIDIAQAVGFNDLSQFNRSFKAYFGAPPRAFRY